MSAAANFVLEGRITAYTAPPIWRAAVELLARNPDQPLVIDASRLEYVDNVGIALLFDLIRRERPPAAKVEVRNLAPTLASLVAAYDPKDFEQGRPPIRRLAYSNIWAELPPSRSTMRVTCSVSWATA